MAAKLQQLTDPSFWDRYWEELPLPSAAAKGQSRSIDAILDVFDRYLASPSGRSVLEVGGAPGQYAAYLARRFAHEVTVLDTSKRGREKTRENFALLGVPGQVHEGDVVDPPPIGPFDIVYSLGLVEHAATPHDALALVAAHLRLAKPGGVLLLGCPNLRGVNRLLLWLLSPAFLRLHNPWPMRGRNWTTFERSFGIRPLFRGYVGGFEPGMFSRLERRGPGAWIVHRLLGALAGRRVRSRRRLDAPLWSGYLIGVYEVPSAASGVG